MSRQRSRRPAPGRINSQDESATELPPRILVLAAVDRAVRHLPARRRAPARRILRECDGAAPAFVISDHLGYSRGTALRRGLRSELDALTREGQLEALTQSGVPVWALTSDGKKLVARYRRRAWARLPESSQHAAWREAREIAEHQHDALRARARSVVASAAALIDADVHDYAALIRAADDLRDVFRRFAGVTYCVFEWSEPDDIKADIDDRVGNAALRNPNNWSPLSRVDR